MSDQRLQLFSSTAAQQRAESQKANITDNAADQASYVLTLLTDPAHNHSMNSLRKTYFPPKLNKIPAHITLFHALPGSKLESDVLPVIEQMVSRTPLYRIRAINPIRLSHGVGIKVADDIDHANDGQRGRNMTRIIHAEFRKKWGTWLSEQDSTPPRFHYTVMNKINDERVIEQALTQLNESFKRGVDMSGRNFDHSGRNVKRDDGDGDEVERKELRTVGEVQGLILWEYEHTGHWTHPKQFKFTGRDR